MTEKQWTLHIRARADAGWPTNAGWDERLELMAESFNDRDALLEALRKSEADNALLRRLLKDLVFARHRVIPRRDKRYCEASLDTSIEDCRFCAPYFAALAEPSVEGGQG